MRDNVIKSSEFSRLWRLFEKSVGEKFRAVSLISKSGGTEEWRAVVDFGEHEPSFIVINTSPLIRKMVRNIVPSKSGYRFFVKNGQIVKQHHYNITIKSSVRS